MSILVVRNVFRPKFGQAKPALAAWTEGEVIMKRLGMTRPTRLLTDVFGPAYTVVLEHTSASLEEFEADGRQIMGTAEWGQWYHEKFVPQVDSSYREVLTIVE
jgi:hypothetical protein